MRMRRLLPLIAVVALLASAVFAGALDKYKSWPSSPQGYFMTSAERAQWKANVKSDADAEQFIQKFLASRGPGFADDVAKRAEMADKHLSVAGRAGSQTLRGKIVILLGPPSSFTVSSHEIQGGRSSSLGGITGGGSSGGGRVGETGASVSDMVDATNQSAMAVSKVNDYTFSYTGSQLPGKPAKDLQIIVQVNPGDGSDKIIDRKVAAQLDDMFEAAAAASIASASTKP